MHFLKSPNRSEFLNGKFCRFYLHDSSYLQLSLDSSIYIPCTTSLWVNDFVSKVCDITGISNENPMFSGGVKQGVLKRSKSQIHDSAEMQVRISRKPGPSKQTRKIQIMWCAPYGVFFFHFMHFQAPWMSLWQSMPITEGFYILSTNGRLFSFLGTVLLIRLLLHR